MNKSTNNYLLVIERQIASVQYIRNIVKQETDNFTIFKEAKKDGYFQIYLVFLPNIIKERANAIYQIFYKRKSNIDYEKGMLSLIEYDIVDGEDKPFLFHLSHNMQQQNHLSH